MMPVSGLVVSLSPQSELRAAAIASLGREPRIEIGVVESGKMAIVVDTESADEDKQLWNWLHTIPGVVFVDVVMVGFEESFNRKFDGI
jgi:nitrate reductase NapAB chaperone NapD